jgi:hypothetical protein
MRLRLCTDQDGPARVIVKGASADSPFRTESDPRAAPGAERQRERKDEAGWRRRLDSNVRLRSHNTL